AQTPEAAAAAAAVAVAAEIHLRNTRKLFNQTEPPHLET
ncbi:MAG: hypothetical protein ACI87T_003967, partial [Planctomycetota bacterium]